MALARLAASMAVAALLPAASHAQGAERFVETFRAGCLAHLPDFAGSAETFRELGFAPSGGRFVRQADGPDMLAEVYERTVDAGRGCVLAFEAGEDPGVLAEVESVVAELSGDDFRRRDAERGGQRVDAFTWTADGREVLLVVLPQVSGMRALNVTVAGTR